MASFEWTEANVSELISLYEENPCLYNTKSKDYFNRDHRSKALEEIATKLGTTAPDVKAKLKSIRTIYTRERKKTRKKKTGQGLDEVYVSKYLHFDKLHFLDDYVVAKGSVSNLKDETHNDEDNPDPEEIQDEEEEDVISVPEKSTKQPTKQTQDKRLTKRQKLEAAENDLIKKAITCMDKATSKGSASATEDGFELFGRYVATELRALNPHAQRLAKLQIQNVLYCVQTESSSRPVGTMYPMEPMPSYNRFSPPMGPEQVSFRPRTPSMSPTQSITDWSSHSLSPLSDHPNSSNFPN